MPYVYLDKRKKPYIYRFQYTDHQGRRCTGTGTTSKGETEDIAAIVQSKERAIRKDWAVAPKSSDLVKGREIISIVAEYLEWGRAQGGIGGRPWSSKHSEKREFYLTFWQKELGLKVLGDLAGIQPRVEAELRRLQQKNKAGKTLQNYADGLHSFCSWCETRGFLDVDPLKGLAPFDTTPKTMRRALTPDEIKRFLEASDGTCYGQCRRPGYEVALATGLRAGELRSLRVKHFDCERGGLILDAEWTKNRKPGFRPLPSMLVAKLKEDCKGKGPNDPLVFVAREASSAIEKDLIRAGLSKWAPGGKVDFHALRVAYDNLVLDSGASVKEAQELMRHSNQHLTMNTYGRVREGRLEKITEAIGDAILAEKSTPLAYSKVVGAEGVHVNDSGDKSLQEKKESIS